MALVGVAAISIVPGFGTIVPREHPDPIGIPTKCMGNTTDVLVDYRYTEPECQRSLERQLTAHAAPVLVCVPGLTRRISQLAAAVSYAYNIGTSAFRRSTAARRSNAHDSRVGSGPSTAGERTVCEAGWTGPATRSSSSWAQIDYCYLRRCQVRIWLILQRFTRCPLQQRIGRNVPDRLRHSEGPAPGNIQKTRECRC